MDAPTTSRAEGTHGNPVEPPSGTSPSRIPGLSTLPAKRPARRRLGFLRGRTKS
jgi:hypothetical protein